MIQIGSRVHLRGCQHGQPGTVLRLERRRVVVLWHDMNDYIGRHPPETLVEAMPADGEARVPPPAPIDPYTRILRKLDADNQKKP
jgi:hypothetical protein